MMNATISADIIKSTSLVKEDVVKLQDYLKEFIDIVEREFSGCWGRIVRGDCIEFVLPNERIALRVAFLLKCRVKAFNARVPSHPAMAYQYRRFIRYGTRIVIGLGMLRTNDGLNGIVDGEAIYNSGRELDRMSSRMRSNMRIVGKGTQRLRIIQAMMQLADELLSHATSRQCETLFWRILGMPEKVIAERAGVTQVAINAQLRSAGWYALANALSVYEELI